MHLCVPRFLVTRFTLCSSVLLFRSALFTFSPFLSSSFLTIISVIPVLANHLLLLLHLRFLYTAFLLSPLFFLSLFLISCAPPFIWSAVCLRGAERASGEPSIFMLSQLNMAPTCVCVCSCLHSAAVDVNYFFLRIHQWTQTHSARRKSFWA